MLFCLLAGIVATAQERIYEKEDSTFITQVIEGHTNASRKEAGNQLLSIAAEFLNREYVAGTLDAHNGEPLVISATELDCTTFVETVLAIYITTKESDGTFEAFSKNLEKIRYRNGKREGYASRLHYISQWIDDSAKQGIITEVTEELPHSSSVLNLNYMSTHPTSYRILKENPQLVKDIAIWEKPYRGCKMLYIPKETLYKSNKELHIKDGDILALTTNIEGLDVVHTGFAFWENGQLHLLHASSAAGKVVKEERSLYLYQKNKKSHTGTRVFRVK